MYLAQGFSKVAKERRGKGNVVIMANTSCPQGPQHLLHCAAQNGLPLSRCNFTAAATKTMESVYSSAPRAHKARQLI